MKKIFIIGLILLLVVGFTTAITKQQIVTWLNNNFSQDDIQILKNINITDMDLSDFRCSDRKCGVQITSKGGISRKIIVDRQYSVCSTTLKNINKGLAEDELKKMNCVEHNYTIQELKNIRNKKFKKILTNVIENQKDGEIDIILT